GAFGRSVQTSRSWSRIMHRICWRLLGLILVVLAKPLAAQEPARTLPGVQPGGAILLPNQWSLRPAGKQMELGDFPVNLALHPSGKWLAALHAGYGEHEVVVVDLERQKIADRARLHQAFYGLAFAPDGKRLFASGCENRAVHIFDFADGRLHEDTP